MSSAASSDWCTRNILKRAVLLTARVLGLQMPRRGVPRGCAAGVLSHGTLMAPIIAPGMGLILSGTVGQVSTGRLFAAGIVPGPMLWASLSITARKRGYGLERDTAPAAREIGQALVGGIWALLFPVILLPGLRVGIFMPSETGTFAVGHAVAVGFFACRMPTARTGRETATLPAGRRRNRPCATSTRAASRRPCWTAWPARPTRGCAR